MQCSALIYYHFYAMVEAQYGQKFVYETMSIQILYNIIIVNKEDAFVQDFIVFFIYNK